MTIIDHPTTNGPPDTTAGWVVYVRRDGTMGVQPTSRRGLANVAACERAGGRVVLRAAGVSRRAAVRAARKMLGLQ